jgi:hypothetical protein
MIRHRPGHGPLPRHPLILMMRRRPILSRTRNALLFLPSITHITQYYYSRPWSPSFAFRVDDALERVLCAEIARLRRRIGEDAFHLCARQLAVQSPCCECALRLRHISHAIVDFFWRSRAAPAGVSSRNIEAWPPILSMPDSRLTNTCTD